MKWSLAAKIMSGYGLSMIIILVVVSASYRTVRQYMHDVEQRKQAHETLLCLERLLCALTDAEAAQRGYLITGQLPYLQRYEKSRQDAAKELEGLATAIRQTPAYEFRWSELETRMGERLESLQQAVDLYQATDGGFEKARAWVSEGQGRRAMEQILQLVSQIQAEAHRTLSGLHDKSQGAARWMQIVEIGGALLALAALLVLGVAVSRNVARPLNEAINVMTSSASQIAGAASQIAASATETAAAITQTTTTTAEVKQTALTAVQKAKTVSDVAQHTEQASLRGLQAVEQMNSGISHIRAQTDSVAASIVRLSDQSQAIGAIISTVDDLAAQSNLLAVNAAIEAAKAGEQGKGFAVVAQEVKSLAEQSKQATAQVRTILNDIQKATSAAVMATEQSGKAVEAGLKQAQEAGESVRTLSDSITQSAHAAIQIAASSEQQLVGMDQLAMAMESVKQASQQNAQGTKQTEDAAHQLMEMARQLHRLATGSE
jgi:methyl-accepting chemotaxis protein